MNIKIHCNIVINLWQGTEELNCRAKYTSLYIAYIKCQPGKVDLEAQAQEMQDWDLDQHNLNLEKTHYLNLNLRKREIERKLIQCYSTKAKI